MLVAMRTVAILSCVLAAGLVSGCFFLNYVPPADIELRFNAGDQPTPVIIRRPSTYTKRSVFTSIDGKLGNHAPTLTVLPDGTLLAAWYSYTGPEELDGAAIFLARKPPNSDTWQPPTLHIDRTAADGNPVLYSEGNNVWLFQAVVTGTGWSTSHVEMQRSSDGGVTWSEPQRIAGPLGLNVRHPPVRLDDHLLLPAYDDLRQRSLFYVSEDGATWSQRASLTTPQPHACMQPSIVALASGRVLAVMRNAGTGWLWVSASDDQGRTWARPQDAGFPNPGSPAVLHRLHSGNLMLVFNDSNELRHPMSIALSGDEGVTWYTKRTLVTGDGVYAYPAVMQDSDGAVHILYSDNRERIGHITVNEAWIANG